MGQRPSRRREIQKLHLHISHCGNPIFLLAIPLTIVQGPTLATLVALIYAAVYIYGSFKAKRYVIDVILASTLEYVAMLFGLIRPPTHFYVIDKT